MSKRRENQINAERAFVETSLKAIDLTNQIGARIESDVEFESGDADLNWAHVGTIRAALADLQAAAQKLGLIENE